MPDSHLPSDLTTVYFGSPTAITKEGNDGFGEKPVGTGPFKVQSLTRGQQLVMVPNKDYWDGAPKLDKLILKPIPDPTTRIAARPTSVRAIQMRFVVSGPGSPVSAASTMSRSAILAAARSFSISPTR